MRIECPGCEAVYNVRQGPLTRHAKCKRCGEALEIPGEEPAEGGSEPASPADDLFEGQGRRGREKPKTLGLAIAVSVVSMLLGLLFIPFTLLSGIGAVALAASDQAGSSEAVEVAGAFMILFLILASGLLGSGIGLLLRKTWGWWGLAVLYVAFLLINLKLIFPVFWVDWGHSRAWKVGGPLLFTHGIPLLVCVVMLVLLMFPKMRLAYGVKQAQRERRRRTVGRVPASRRR